MKFIVILTTLSNPNVAATASTADSPADGTFPTRFGLRGARPVQRMFDVEVLAEAALYCRFLS